MIIQWKLHFAIFVMHMVLLHLVKVSVTLAENRLRAYSHQRRTFFPSRFVRTRAFTPKQKNVGRRMNTSALIGLDVITC